MNLFNPAFYAFSLLLPTPVDDLVEVPVIGPPIMLRHYAGTSTLVISSMAAPIDCSRATKCS